MTKCPFCDAELVEGRREIEKGVWAAVEVCPNCRDEWIDEAEHDWLVGLFKRKIFSLDVKVAVANAVDALKDDTAFDLRGD